MNFRLEGIEYASKAKEPLPPYWHGTPRKQVSGFDNSIVKAKIQRMNDLGFVVDKKEDAYFKIIKDDKGKKVVAALMKIQVSPGLSTYEKYIKKGYDLQCIKIGDKPENIVYAIMCKNYHQIKDKVMAEQFKHIRVPGVENANEARVKSPYRQGTPATVYTGYDNSYVKQKADLMLERGFVVNEDEDIYVRLVNNKKGKPVIGALMKIQSDSDLSRHEPLIEKGYEIQAVEVDGKFGKEYAVVCTNYRDLKNSLIAQQVPSMQEGQGQE